MNESGKELQIKKTKHRSPNHPAIGLEKALEKAVTIKQKAGMQLILIPVALQVLGYKEGSGNQLVAALKSFGLIDTIGEKEKRQLRITEFARQIIDGHPDKAALLKEAALKPELHRELWEKYQGDNVADEIIRSYLVWERKFNNEVVDGFIAQFRNTLVYANMELSSKKSSLQDSLSDKTSDSLPSLFADTSVIKPSTTALINDLNQKHDRVNTHISGNEIELKFNISQKSKARIIFNGEVTQEAIELLSKMLDLQKLTFPKEADISRAALLSSEKEVPIKVVGSLGMSPDGKSYIKIAQGDDLNLEERD